MSNDPRTKLAELRHRTWSTAKEYEALNREYDEALAALAKTI